MSKYTVSIQTTSNPKIIKFEANLILTRNSSFEYANIDEAKNSPLAQQLFHLPFVKKVYLSGNFVALERFDIVEWADVQDAVALQIENYLNKGGEVILETETKKVPVTVYAESTPNPAVLKFVCNKKLVTSFVEFTSIDEAKDSPLASELFHFPFVKSVFIDENYVSVTKYEVADWNDITMELREFMKNFLEKGKDVINNEAILKSQKSTQQLDADFEALDDISKEIVNILEEYVKPAVASDGGNIQFESYDPSTKNVRVILQGACSGCPSSTFTLKNGIENMLKEMLKDKVETVEAING
ncbi:MAG: NifU family protein [Bacteroidia bacterium]|nr:NifU family protein [Bacteroidia bacterium]MBT8278618.1 NifU family protein [Bacteroidia bacterium]NNK61207.1 NifU family protein [Flavobacteriaceae bacterium]NNL33655.1 NifU family protein [Flavobacteriaceae bacterium]RZW56485.1 MAG: NifU family protein [Flavobacteriaceae bacterium]